MKKKLIWLFLSVFMIAALLPITALAADAPDVSTWANLQAAIDNTPGTEGELATETTTITLTHDLTAGGSDNEITIANGKNITLNLNGHVIRGNGSGSVITIHGGELTLIGSGTIIGGNGEKGGGVYVVDGTYTMNDGTISGNTASKGGGVYVDRGGRFEMNGGNISDNTANNYGGGVYVYSKGSFKMTGGTISNNSAIQGGGGVYVGFMGDYCTFEMTGGTISNNHSENNGGGVYVIARGKFRMYGGIISENTAVNNGGGVCFFNENVTLGGTAKIIDNSRGNLYLSSGKSIDLDSPKEEMRVGVTMDSGTGQFTTRSSENDAKYFSADDSACMVKYNAGGYLEVVRKAQVEVVTNTIPDSKADFEKTKVSGLENVLKKYEDEDEGKPVIVKLTVEPKEEAKVAPQVVKEVKAIAGRGKKIEFIDLSLWLMVDDEPKNIGCENDELLAIEIPFDFTNVDVKSLMIIRNHGGETKMMQRDPAAGEEGFTVDKAAGTLTIHAKGFSDYAIAYVDTTIAPPTGITESDMTTPIMLGFIVLTVVGLGYVLMREREQ